MMCYGPRIGQWVMYGPDFKIGKVLATQKRYRTRSGRAWGPVVQVFVAFNSTEEPQWWPKEQTKTVGPKARLKSNRDSISCGIFPLFHGKEYTI